MPEKQYIVVPRSGKQIKENLLLAFLDMVNEMTEVSVQRISGPHDNPKRVIIRAEDETANELRQKFKDQLIIEEDKELKMFSS